MCFLILRAKLIIIETLPCYCPSFYKTSNTTIDMGGRLTLNFPFSTLAPFENFRFDLLRRINRMCYSRLWRTLSGYARSRSLYRYVFAGRYGCSRFAGDLRLPARYGFLPCESRDAEALTTGTSRLSLTFSLSQIRSIGKR